MATQMISRIRKKFEVRLSLPMIFEIPTIAQLAEWVLTKQLEQVKQDEFDRILAEVDGMSDKEVRQQITDH